MKKSVVLTLFLPLMWSIFQQGQSFFPKCIKEVGEKSVLYYVKRGHGRMMLNLDLNANNVYALLHEVETFVAEAQVKCADIKHFTELLDDYCSIVNQLGVFSRASKDTLLNTFVAGKTGFSSPFPDEDNQNPTFEVEVDESLNYFSLRNRLLVVFFRSLNDIRRNQNIGFFSVNHVESFKARLEDYFNLIVLETFKFLADSKTSVVQNPSANFTEIREIVMSRIEEITGEEFADEFTKSWLYLSPAQYEMTPDNHVKMKIFLPLVSYKPLIKPPEFEVDCVNRKMDKDLEEEYQKIIEESREFNVQKIMRGLGQFADTISICQFVFLYLWVITSGFEVNFFELIQVRRGLCRKG